MHFLFGTEVTEFPHIVLEIPGIQFFVKTIEPNLISKNYIYCIRGRLTNRLQHLTKQVVMLERH